MGWLICNPLSIAMTGETGQLDWKRATVLLLGSIDLSGELNEQLSHPERACGMAPGTALAVAQASTPSPSPSPSMSVAWLPVK